MADQLNPSWRKVLLSGSNAHVHEITASGISAAVSNPTLQKVLVYDTNSGAFYYTGSYGGSGGGGTPGGSDTYIQFNDSDTFGGLSNFTFNKNTSTPTVTIQGGTDSGNTAKLLITASNTAQAQIHLKSLRPQIWFEDSIDGTPDHYLLQNGSNLVMGTGSGVTGPITFNPTNGKIATSGDISGSKTGSFGELEGIIDTSGAQANYRLIYNGSKFVAVPEDTSFEFAINSFNVTGYGSTSLLIGNSSHVVFNSSDLTFSATYNAGPPDSATASIRKDWIVSDPILVAIPMTGPNYTSGTNSSDITIGDLEITAPDSSQRIDFELTASKGGDTLYNSPSTTIYFYNHMKYGKSTSQILNTAGISSLSGEYIANDSNYYSSTNRTVTVGTSEYLNIAVRNSGDQPPQVYCGTGANQLTVAMNPTITNKTPFNRGTVAPYTNDNNYAEPFNVYSSENANLSTHSSTFQFTNSTAIKNYFFWGTSSVATPDESLVEGLLYADSQYDVDTITGQTLTAIPAFTSKYVYIAIPTRHGIDDTDYQFKLNNFEFDVGSPTTVTITNPVGFQENYYVYRSNYALTYASPISIVIDTV